METFKKILSWMRGLSTAGKVLSTIIVALVTALMLFCACSCGTTHAVVRTKDSGSASVSIHTNNPVSVETSPDISISFNKSNKNE